MTNSDRPIPIEELLDYAPQLQQLAGRLAAEWDRDDVVQETWLRVLEQPPRHRRNLASWLSGALRMRSADHYRRETSQRQRVARAADRGAKTRDSSTTPEELLERTEAHEALVRSLRDLEEPYRHALLLHYFDGLSTQQIASQLKVPKSTVLSHLRRGRERLRKLLSSRYGDQSFALCLTAAGPFAPAPPAFNPAPAESLAKPLLIVTGLVAASIVVGAALYGPEPTDTLDQERNSATLAAQLEGDVALPTTDGGGDRAPAEARGEERGNLATVESDQLVRILGRCIDDQTGAPLVHALVKVHFRASNDEAMARYPNPDWMHPDDLHTDASGAFMLEFEEHKGMQLSISIEPEGYAPRTARWSSISDKLFAGTKTDLGEIRLTPGHVIQGRVVDEGGQPVEGLYLLASDLPLPIATDMAANDARGGESDSNGEFTFSVPVPPGTYPLRLSSRRKGYALRDPARFEVSEQGLPRPLEVVVYKVKEIRGKVVDAAGEPIRGAYLIGEAAVSRSGRMMSSWTREDGSFRIERVGNAGPIQLHTRGGVTEPWQGEDWIEWDTHDLVITLDRRPNLDIVVVEEPTGAPVESFAVLTQAIRSGNQQSWSSSDWQHGGTHEGGALTIESVPQPPFWLAVIPSQPGVGPGEWLRVDQLPAVGHPIQVKLPPLTEYTLRVEDSAGVPIVGSHVQVLTLDGASHPLPSHFRPRPTRLRPDQQVNGLTQPLLLSEAVTSADGTATVWGDPSVPMFLRIAGNHVETWVDPWTPVTGQVSTVRVDPPAVLRVTLTEPTEWPIPQVTLFSLADPDRRIEAVPFDSTGVAETNQLPPGDYAVQFAMGNRVKDANGSGASGGTLLWPGSFGTVSLRGGKTVELEMDLSDLKPATVEGTIHTPAGPVSGGHVYLRLTLPPRGQFDQWYTTRTTFGAFLVDELGRFEAPGIPPGPIEVDYIPPVREKEAMFSIRLEPGFEVASGTRQVVALTGDPHGIRLRLLHASGAPATHQPLRAQTSSRVSGAPSNMWELVTDEHGWVSLDAMPADGPTIYVDGQSLGRVLPDPSKRWVERTLTLPE